MKTVGIGSTKPKNLCDLLLTQAEKFGDRTFLRKKGRSGQGVRDERIFSFRETAREARELAAGLICLGLKAGDRVVIFSPNGPFWVIADQAIQMVGGVGVAFYPTELPRRVATLLRDCQARFILTGSSDHLRIVLSAARDNSNLSRIISLEPLTERIDPRVLSCEEVQELGRDLTDPAELERRIRGIREIDPLALVYTPGTTAEPKGVVLTQANLLANLHQIIGAPLPAFLIKRGLPLQNLSHLPLAHISARLFDYYLPLFFGGEITFAESLATLPQDLIGIRPQIINSLPYFFEQIYEFLQIELEVLDGETREEIDEAREVISEWARAEEEGRSVSPAGLFDLPRVYRKVRETILSRLGLDRWVFGVSVGGRLDPEVGGFLSSLGVMVNESYGLTEAGAALAVNFWDFKDRQSGPKFGVASLLDAYLRERVERPAAGEIPFAGVPARAELLAINYLLFPKLGQRRGTVGRPLRGTTVQIAGDGEILVRGPQVFNPRYGYWARPDASQGAFNPEGYLKTGDLGEVDKHGYLRVIDRKEDVLISSGGRRIAPQPLEEALRRDLFIADALILGQGRRFIAALIIPDFVRIKHWAEGKGVTFSSAEEMLENQLVADLIRERVAAINQKFSGFEQIKRFQFLIEPFQEAEGELTPTLKFRRAVILEKYRDLIEEMYQE